MPYLNTLGWLARGPVSFFLFMSGVDPKEAYDCGEQRRYASIGALMTFMFGWYSLAMGHALATTAGAGNNHWVQIGFGVGWAALLTLIDRIVFGQPLMKDSFGYRFIKVFALRGLLAVAGSLVTSIGALLFLFSHDVDTQIAKDRVERSTTILGPIETSPDVVNAQAKITAAGARLASLQKAVTDQQKVVTKDEQNIQCESAGTCGTGVPDDEGHIGPMTKLLMEREATDKQALDSATSTLKAQTPLIQADINKQNQIIQAARDTGNNTLARDNGIQERTDALRKLIKHDWTMWLWILVIVTADLCVVLFKAALPASKVDIYHRENASHAKAVAAAYEGSPQQQQVILNDLSRRAELDDVRSQLVFAHRKASLDAQRASLDAKQARDRHGGPSLSGLTTRGRRAIGVGLLILAAGGLTAWATMSGDKHVPNASGAGPSRAVTKVLQNRKIPTASFAAYKIPNPSKIQATAARKYLITEGKPLVELHRATKAAVSQYSASSCATLRKATTKTNVLLNAAASSPDQTITELALDEIHDIATLSSCSAAPPPGMSHLAGIDALLDQRLRQDGVAV